jgi:hypothetical protein
MAEHNGNGGLEVSGWGTTIKAYGGMVTLLVVFGLNCGFVYLCVSMLMAQNQALQSEHVLLRGSFEDLAETNRDMFLAIATPNKTKEDMNPVVQERAKRIIERKARQIVEEKQ